MPTVENDSIVETPTEARAGGTGHNVRWALGVVALIVAFAIVYLVYFG